MIFATITFKIDCDMALSGEHAIELVTETDYDIVFMDHMMPEMDGVETAQKIRKLNGKYEHLTIIALTANAISGAKEMFLSNGFNGFLAKPIEISELSEILYGFLPQEKIENADETQEEKATEVRAEAPPMNTTESKSEAAPQEVTDAAEASGSFMDRLKKISVINTAAGMSNVYDMEDLYRETIELFYNTLPNDCNKLESFIAAGDMHNFSVAVHAMKSSLATIGATGLSETALKLEKASKEKNASYCDKHFPEFIASIRELSDKLSVLFSGGKSAS